MRGGAWGRGEQEKLEGWSNGISLTFETLRQGNEILYSTEDAFVVV